MNAVADESTLPVRRLIARARARADVLLLSALLCAGIAVYYVAGRGLTFFFDEWDFILDRRGNSVGTFLQPDNGHLVAVPVLIYKALWTTVGLGHYGAYRLTDLALNLLCVVLLFVFVRRRIGGIVAVLAAASLLFLGNAWQVTLWAAGIVSLSAIAAGLGALLALERRDRGGDIAAALLLALSLSSSGLGLVFLAGAAVHLLLERLSWRRLWLIAIPAILYAAWYLNYGQNEASASSLTAVPSYVFDSFKGVVRALCALGTEKGKLLALLALAAMAFAIVKRRLWRQATPFAVIALAFWMLTAVSRAQLHEPAASRYLYPGALMVLLVAAELVRGLRFAPLLVVALAVLVAHSSWSNVNDLYDGAAGLRGIDETVAAELAAVELEKAVVSANFQPDTRLAPQITAGPYLAAVRDLGSPAMSLSTLVTRSAPIRASADRALVGAIMPVLVSHRRVPTDGVAPRIDGRGGGTLKRDEACVVFRPRVGGVMPSFDLVVPRHGLAIQSESTVDVRLLRFAADYPQTPSTTLTPGFSLLRPPPDTVLKPWRVRLASSSTTRVCTVR